jgi:hypothetical protein
LIFIPALSSSDKSVSLTPMALRSCSWSFSTCEGTVKWEHTDWILVACASVCQCSVPPKQARCNNRYSNSGY